MIEWAAPLHVVWRARWVEAMLAFAFVFALALSAGLGLMRAQPNWDAFAYTALVLERSGEDAAALHERAYASVLAHSTASQRVALIRGDEYRARQATDPTAFASMLPMYRVKSGYVTLLRTFGTDREPYQAALFVNAISFALIVSMSLFWLVRSGAAAASPFVLLGILAFEPGDLVASMSPALPTAALVLAAFGCCALRRPLLSVVPLALATTLRPDTVIVAFALLLAFALCGRRILAPALAFAATIIVYFVLTSGNEHIGWWAHYYFSNVDYQDTLVGFAPPVSAVDYLRGIARGGFLSLAHEVWPVVALALFCGWGVMLHSGLHASPIATTLLLANLLAVGGKFVAFPLPDDRIYFVFALAAMLLLAATWRPKLA